MSIRRAWLFAIVVLLASASVCAPAVPAPLPPRQQWLLVSDVHFNPFDDPSLVDRLVQAPASAWHSIFSTSVRPVGPYFTDTNFALLESALGAMRTRLDPTVVVIAGDFLGHAFSDQFAKAEPNAPPAIYQQFVDKTIAFLASEFNGSFPRAQFLIAVGNNDGYCGDYKSTPASPFLARMAAAWHVMVNRHGAAPTFERDFSNGGYYTATLRFHPRVPAIVLNSVFWSRSYENSCGISGSDPGSAELDWLDATLRALDARRPILLAHIPPGIDEYSSARGGAAAPLYKEAYTQRLLTTLGAQHVSAGAFILGHIHHATFEIADMSGGQLGALVVPSISPNQGTNPAFIGALVDSTRPAIADTTTYVLPLASSQNQWTALYSFDSAYGLSQFDAPNLLKLQAMMATDAQMRDRFFSNYNSGSTIALPSPSQWAWYWCGHTNLTPGAYAACVKPFSPLR